MSERGDPDRRVSDDYKKDNWTVLDVDRVDKVFATGLFSEDEDEPVRIDLDGYAAPSSYRTVGDEGDDVNVSVWLNVEQAESLCEYLSKAIERANSGDDA